MTLTKERLADFIAAADQGDEELQLRGTVLVRTSDLRDLVELAERALTWQARDRPSESRLGQYHNAAPQHMAQWGAATMTFSEALVAMKHGERVARLGWNAKGMYIWLSSIADGLEPCVMLYTAQGKYQPGWLASQADLLANDWILSNT